jgi:hypothetical protein
MGFFGNFVFSEGRWADAPTSDEYLSIDIHDSDFATIEYRPTGRGRGRLYLGFEPRHYFEDPAASEQVDVSQESSGLSGWAQSVLDVRVSPEQLRNLMADPAGADPESPFVEDTVVQLIALFGLPLPTDLEPNA